MVRSTSRNARMPGYVLLRLSMRKAGPGVPVPASVPASPTWCTSTASSSRNLPLGREEPEVLLLHLARLVLERRVAQLPDELRDALERPGLDLRDRLPVGGGRALRLPRQVSDECLDTLPRLLHGLGQDRAVHPAVVDVLLRAVV